MPTKLPTISQTLTDGKNWGEIINATLSDITNAAEGSGSVTAKTKLRLKNASPNGDDGVITANDYVNNSLNIVGVGTKADASDRRIDLIAPTIKAQGTVIADGGIQALSNQSFFGQERDMTATHLDLISFSNPDNRDKDAYLNFKRFYTDFYIAAKGNYTSPGSGASRLAIGFRSPETDVFSISHTGDISMGTNTATPTQLNLVAFNQGATNDKDAYINFNRYYNDYYIKVGGKYNEGTDYLGFGFRSPEKDFMRINRTGTLTLGVDNGVSTSINIVGYNNDTQSDKDSYLNFKGFYTDFYIKSGGTGNTRKFSIGFRSPEKDVFSLSPGGDLNILGNTFNMGNTTSANSTSINLAGHYNNTDKANYINSKHFHKDSYIKMEADYIKFGFRSPEIDMFTLTRGGNATLAGVLTQNSDETLKKDIVSLKDSLSVVSKLRGVNYFWKDENRETSKQVGFIAQEVEKVLPEVVHTNEDGIKSLAYQNMVPVLVEAIKELKAEIDELKKKVA